jgi:hypothetical protein
VIEYRSGENKVARLPRCKLQLYGARVGKVQVCFIIVLYDGFALHRSGYEVRSKEISCVAAAVSYFGPLHMSFHVMCAPGRS